MESRDEKEVVYLVRAKWVHKTWTTMELDLLAEYGKRIEYRSAVSPGTSLQSSELGTPTTTDELDRSH